MLLLLLLLLLLLFYAPVPPTGSIWNRGQAYIIMPLGASFSENVCLVELYLYLVCPRTAGENHRKAMSVFVVVFLGRLLIGD